MITRLRQFGCRQPRPAAAPGPSTTTIFSVSSKSVGLRRPPASARTGHHAMQQLSAKTLPQGYTFEWSGIFAGRISLGIDHAHPLRLGNAGRLSDALGAIRSFVLPFIILLAVPWLCSSALRPMDSQPAERRLLPGGISHACRLSVKERYLDRGFAEQFCASAA